MSRFTNTNVKLTLSDLRSKIRNGVVIVSYSSGGIDALRSTVAVAFGIDKDDFNTENFNPQTFRRFAKLFDVPMIKGELDKIYYPTQDETATALQNFINRRADPWSHSRPVAIISDETDAPQFLEDDKEAIAFK